MIASFEPSVLSGKISAPSSKSIAHRFLILAALCQENSVIEGIDFNEDVLATIDCLKALGAKMEINKNSVTVNPESFLKAENPVLKCRESGSTLRFFIPLALTLDKKVEFKGSRRLFERPLTVYEEIAKENGFLFEKGEDFLTLCGNLKSGDIKVKGDISSQFITGLIFALVHLNKEASIEVLPPFESRSYVDLTLGALKVFGANIYYENKNKIKILPVNLTAFSGRVEGDYSSAAFLDAFNRIGSDISVENLNPQSLQGDKAYIEYFEKIEKGTPTLDISNCPDLAPVLIAAASLKNGATLLSTERLKIKESDRGQAMHKELKKLGGGLIFGENSITVPRQSLEYKGSVLNGHNDHRIVMALSVILSKIGGEIEGVEAVSKSYKDFFADIKTLGAKVILK